MKKKNYNRKIKYIKREHYYIQDKYDIINNGKTKNSSRWLSNIFRRKSNEKRETNSIEEKESARSSLSINEKEKYIEICHWKNFTF